MKTLAVLDCETDPFKFNRVPKPFVWGLMNNLDYSFMTFYNETDLINFLKDKNWIVYAHNGGKFDYHFLLNFIGEDTEITIINGRIAKFKIGRCEFRDSFNILPVPLSSYNKTTIDYDKFEEEVRWTHIDEILNYLRDDCRFTLKLIETFITDYGLNITLASAAFKYWKKNFYQDDLTETDDNFYRTFKDFYYGGRVECFQKGIINSPFKVFDINSAYPDAMTRNHPWGTSFQIFDNPPDDFLIRQQDFITLYCSPDGCFPMREKDGSLSFPSGPDTEDVYFITGWEFITACKLGLLPGKTKFWQVLRFKDSINFTPYVDHFFKQKAEFKDNDPARYLISKLFLNSLYGKFAANPNKYKSYETRNPAHIEMIEKFEEKTYTGMLGQWALMSKPLDESEKHFYNIATAASITGFVRAKMMEAIHTSIGLLYCDTDSIACTSNNDLGISSQHIGQWNLEGEFIRGAIAGKKLYAFQKENGEYKIASKGVKLNGPEIFQIAEGGEIEYNNIAPTFGLSGVKFISRKVRIT